VLPINEKIRDAALVSWSWLLQINCSQLIYCQFSLRQGIQLTSNVVNDKRCFLLLQSFVSKGLLQDTRKWIQTSLLKSRVQYLPKAVAGQLLVIRNTALKMSFRLLQSICPRGDALPAAALQQLCLTYWQLLLNGQCYPEPLSLMTSETDQYVRSSHLSDFIS
jgi:hypothetical protein